MNPDSHPARILVVDDEPDLRTLYELTLLREAYLVETAENILQARALLAEHSFDVMITDMRLPDGLGMALLTDPKVKQDAIRCVVITAYGSANNAVEALKTGAFDYLTKPVDLKQFRSVIASAVKSGKALQQGSLDLMQNRLAGAALPGQQALERLIGRSASMRQIKERVLKVAASMAPVMVTGESGSGKELVARAIHANSHRATGPWVAVNCSAIPENLLEAEFFGVKKGAYTGAQQDREGFFQAANSGTLFLDEIGDLPLAMQAKLLRAIQERRIRPLGSSHEELLDVRIVSATHKNLAHEVQTGAFRQDLYYRLNVIDLVLPPLRERREDLPELCTALLTRIAQESALPVPDVAPSLIERLAQLPLPGNVRELENLLHRCVALGDGTSLHLAALDPCEADPACSDGADNAARTEAFDYGALPSDLQRFLDNLERKILLQALREAAFNRTAAAARLGLSLRQIRYRIAQLQIDIPDVSDSSNETGSIK